MTHEDIRGGKKEEQTILKKQVSRRQFLRAVGVYGAAGAFSLTQSPKIATVLEGLNWLYARKQNEVRLNKEWEGKSVEEREGLIQELRAKTKEALNHPDAIAILNEGSDEEIYNLLSAVPVLSREDVRGTSIDFKPEEWPSVLVGSGKRLIENKRPELSDESNRKIDKQDLINFYRGNGIFISPNELLTNHHVVESVLPPDHEIAQRLSQLRDETVVDATTILFSDDQKARRVFPRNEWADAAQFNGEIFANPAIDPDWSSAENGTKLGVSAAIHVTPHLVKFFKRQKEFGDYSDKLLGSYLMICAPGEALPMPKPLQEPYATDWGEATHTEILTKGTSGSPVFLRKKFAGLQFSAGTIAGPKINDPILEVSFFEGTDKLAKVIDAGMRVDVDELPKRQELQGGSGMSGSSQYEGEWSDYFEIYTDPAEVYRNIIRRRRKKH